jgi:hypothetical protein
MADEVLRCAARTIVDLYHLARELHDADYPGSAIRLQGAAGLLRGLEGELIQAPAGRDANRESPIGGARVAS